MDENATLSELEAAIAAVQENIRTLVEQAAAYSGAADEERNADRIAEQQERLEELERRRGRLLAQEG
jgi:hypothetical protein